ncbi:hypothetical protein EDB85DRAFT_1615117 [Lactarius pseudohatsudake]|nr:hypothetical protein EDB85DRAFT_1615117 [Lactarius pseudohatsudake]
MASPRSAFDIPHPACAASSFVASAFCAINSSCRRHFFRPRSLQSHYPTSGHVRQRLHMGLATFYGIMPLVSGVGVGLGLAHYRELLAQIGESVKRSLVKLPAFPASWHRDGHSVVRNASSWPSALALGSYVHQTHSLRPVVSLISMDVAHLAVADILLFMKSQHSRTSSLLRGHGDSRSRDCVLCRL